MRFPRPKHLLFLVSTLAALASPTLARAADPTPSEISVARRLFDEGKKAEDAGRWREAADRFRQAALIKDTPGIRFHLARCEEERGAFVEALLEYDRARELIEGGVKAPDVERLLNEARERVRAKVALVTLRLPDATQNASVSVDGKAVSASVLNVPLPINPGRHRLQAAAPGRTS
jgi:tetratricopeptide (TPR) repeat protein